MEEPARQYVADMTKKFGERKTLLAKRKRKYNFKIDVKTSQPAPYDSRANLPYKTLVEQRKAKTAGMDERFRVYELLESLAMASGVAEELPLASEVVATSHNADQVAGMMAVYSFFRPVLGEAAPKNSLSDLQKQLALVADIVTNLSS